MSYNNVFQEPQLRFMSMQTSSQGQFNRLSQTITLGNTSISTFSNIRGTTCVSFPGLFKLSEAPQFPMISNVNYGESQKHINNVYNQI